MDDRCEVVGGACLLSADGAELAATAAAAAAAATAAANGFAAPCPPSYLENVMYVHPFKTC